MKIGAMWNWYRIIRRRYRPVRIGLTG